MTKVIAKVDFTTSYDEYVKGEEIKNLTYEQIVKLNEKGFIEPLSYRDLVLLKKELENKKKEE